MGGEGKEKGKKPPNQKVIIDTYIEQTDNCQKGVGGLDEKGEGIKKKIKTQTTVW